MTRHILRSNPGYGWHTGRDAEGHHVLIGRFGNTAFCFRFESGKMIAPPERRPLENESPTTGDDVLSSWKDEVLAKEKNIRIHPFQLDDPEFPIGVAQLPATYENFVENAWDFDPAERAHFSVLINDWKERHHFVLLWDSEFWCDEDGHVLHREAIGGTTGH